MKFRLISYKSSNPLIDGAVGRGPSAQQLISGSNPSFHYDPHALHQLAHLLAYGSGVSRREEREAPGAVIPA